MAKTLRADMEEQAFYDFKGLFGELNASTNDEAIEGLIDSHNRLREVESEMDEIEEKCRRAVMNEDVNKEEFIGELIDQIENA